MVYAIIHAVSDVEELVTVAYAEKAAGLAEWFIGEVKDTADMYLSEEKDFEEIEKACKGLDVFCEEDGADVQDIDGITVEAGGISVSVVGAFYNYEDMKKALCEFVSEKPEYKKLNVPDNENESEKIIDNLNAELIRCSL